ncbi:ABC transporter permease [Candidatus Acetothermia bacterium]|nr:ABC transporter permease [Candidatus Acetothermia bacterium]
MGVFIIRRIAYMIPLLVITSMLVFGVFAIMPGTFLDQFKFDPAIDAAELARQAARLGLDQPLHIQYWRWISGVVQGDLGFSFSGRQPVLEFLFRGRLMWTVLVAVSTFLFTWIVSFPIGIYSATHQYKAGDNILTGLAFFGMSIPNFFFALLIIWLLVTVFRVGDLGLGVAGIVGAEFRGAPWSFDKFLSFLWHLWPPVLVIGTAGMAGLVRFTRGFYLDALGEQYVLTARAKGLTETKVKYKHIVRNILNPFITSLGMGLSGFISGDLIAAIIFNIPTVARAYWFALQAQDIPVLMAGLLLFTFIMLVGNLLADISLAAVDPRIRYN